MEVRYGRYSEHSPFCQRVKILLWLPCFSIQCYAVDKAESEWIQDIASASSSRSARPARSSGRSAKYCSERQKRHVSLLNQSRGARWEKWSNCTSKMGIEREPASPPPPAQPSFFSSSTYSYDNLIGTEQHKSKHEEEL